MSSRIDNWCRREEIAIAGHLPFVPEMVEAMVKGLSIIELDSDSSISRKIKEIWYKIINSN
jgi:MinD superfamily P-loop ATPase